MNVIILALTICWYFVSNVSFATQSVIVDIEGYACMGDDKSKKDTEHNAMMEAKKMAGELAITYLKSETQVKNFTVEKDLVSAYTNATIRVLQEIDKSWYQDGSMGACFKVKIKAEVVPDATSAMKSATSMDYREDPGAPLNIQVWTDRREYKKGESIKVFIKGNKPFFARVLNKDPAGDILQLLPNPFRMDNYFSGMTVYQVPSDNDRFLLEITPPLGIDTVIVYASTAPLGDISLKPMGGVYRVTTKAGDLAVLSRGIKIREKNALSAAEFFEDTVVIKTGH